MSRQCNVQGTDPDHVVEDYITKIWAGADEVAWNELHTDPQKAAVRALPDSWSIIVGQLGITFRKSVFAQVEETWEEANGGVAHVTPIRGNLAAKARHIATRQLHWRECDHVVHHIEAGGRARIVGAIRGQNARARHHFGLIVGSTQSHVRGGRLASMRSTWVRRVLGLNNTGTGLALAPEDGAPTFGTGDLNVDYKAEKHLAPARRTPWFPLTAFTKGGLTIVVPRKNGLVEGTHGGRCIDQGWLLNR